MSFIRKNLLLLLIIVIPTLLTLFGLSYGLPMHLIGDEESIATGAFKMLELKTLIPALYPEDFRPFYYPPVMAYLIIAISVPVILFKFIMVGFSATALTDFFALDQNLIWISARVLVLFFSAATLIVIYHLGRELYGRNVGLIATALLASSFFFNNLSHWIKHWVFAVFFAYLTFLLLYKYYNRTLKNKFMPAIIGSLAIGTSYVASIGIMFTGIYGILQRKKVENFSKFLIISLGVGVVLGGGLALLNYPEIIRLLGPEDGSLEEPKSFLALWQLFYAAWLTFLYQEVVIAITAITGLIFVAKHRKKNFLFLVTSVIYFGLLYLLFHFEIRYIYFALPAIILIAASFIDYVTSNIKSKSTVVLILILFFTWPVSTSLKYHSLILAGDTRVQAVKWVQNNISDEFFIMDSDKIRLPRTIESLELQRELGRLNASERYYLSNKDRIVTLDKQFNYQNIHFWDKESLINLDEHLSELQPEYFIIEYWDKDQISEIDKNIINRSTLIKLFSQSDLDEKYDINGNFFVFNKILFSLDRLGPNVEIYEIDYSGTH